MARSTTTRLVCDLCRKETQRIVAKLQYIPVIPGVRAVNHSNYTHHCDVGECCGDKLLSLFKFRKRVSAQEYQAQRKRSGAMS
jgi:hypothetical protein